MNPEEKDLNTPEVPRGEIHEPIKALRTYQGDVEEIISKNNLSATSILVAEDDRRRQAPENPKNPGDSSARNKFFILLGTILVLLGVITVGAIYSIKSNEKAFVAERAKSIVSFSKELVLPVASSTRNELISKIVSENKLFKDPVNSVLFINTTNPDQSAFDVRGVLELLAPRMPGTLLRSFTGKYMLGVYSYDKNEPFIILTTSDYAQSFAGMLKWEKDMSSDLGDIFSIIKTASSTEEFIDLSLKNKDLRVLRDEKGNTELLYSFIDKNTLIIAKNESLFGAIIAKYFISTQAK